MQRASLLLFAIFLQTALFSQNEVYDDFQDKDLNTGLLWQGDTAHFNVNSARQLQLNQIVADTSIIWIQLPVVNNDTLAFQFWIRENFSPSSLNYGRFFFYAATPDFQNATNCYYLQFGESGTSDAIRLYARFNGQDSLLASGPLGNIANAFAADLKLIMTANSIQLLAKFSSSINDELQFETNIAPQSWQPYAGFSFHYTAANAAAFFIDDFYFGKVLSETDPKLIITEIMADPDTLFGLPDIEYLEIYNNGAALIQLKGMKIQDGNGSCTLPSFWLAPEAYVALVATNKSAAFDIAAIVEVAAFPSLNNAGEFIALKNIENEIMDQLVYQNDWYPTSLLTSSGISLERKSLQDPCSNQDNWGASLAALGGTPGTTNSIFDPYSDSIAPLLTNTEVLDAHYLALQFSEPMDSLSLVNSIVHISPNIGLFEKQILNFQNVINGAQMLLFCNDTILPSNPYHIQIEAAADCWNNTQELLGNFIRYQIPQKGDLLINEILFDPPNEGQDFVELYNHSGKYLDLSQCGIHNCQDSIFLSPVKMAPQQYLAICPDTQFLIDFYPNTLPQNLRQFDLPYFYNDSGTCVLFHESFTLDSLHYTALWHFPLLADSESFSLERIQSNAPTQEAENWFSAAQNSGGATPGRVNSQQSAPIFKGQIHLTYPELSPDLDGYHDQLEIVYEMKDPGMMACVEIYALGGQRLQNVLFNELIGTKGVCYWDGSTQFGTLAPAGIYVLCFRAFSTNPSVFFEKKILFSVCYKA